MPVVAMKVLTANPVEKSNNLRVYTFAVGNETPVQIVANLSNVYEVGDVAAVALVGTRLSDGLNSLDITARTVRGVFSQGMALGKVDAEPGTDLSAQFNATETPA